MGVKKTPFTQIKGRRILKQNGGIRKKPRWAWKKKGSAKMTNKQKGILFINKLGQCKNFYIVPFLCLLKEANCQLYFVVPMLALFMS